MNRRALDLAVAIALVGWGMILVSGVIVTDPASDAAQHAATGRDLPARGVWEGYVPKFLLPDGTEEPAWYPGGYHLLAGATSSAAGAIGVRLIAATSYVGSALLGYALLRRLGHPLLGVGVAAGHIAYAPAFEFATEPYVEPVLLPLIGAGLFLVDALARRASWGASVALGLVIFALSATKQQGWFAVAGLSIGSLAAAAVSRNGPLARGSAAAIVLGVALAAPLLAIYATTFLFTPLAMDDFFGTYVNAAISDPVGTIGHFVSRMPAYWPLGVVVALVAIGGGLLFMRVHPSPGAAIASAGVGALLLAPIWLAEINSRLRYWLPLFILAVLAGTMTIGAALRGVRRPRRTPPGLASVCAALLLVPAVVHANGFPERFDDSEAQFPGPPERFTSVRAAGEWADAELPPAARLLAVRKNEVVLYANREAIDYPRVNDFETPREFVAWLDQHRVDAIWLDRARVASAAHDDQPGETLVRWLTTPGAARLLYRNAFVDIFSARDLAITDIPRDVVSYRLDTRAFEPYSWPVRVEPAERWQPGANGAVIAPRLAAYGRILLPTNSTANGWLGITYLDTQGEVVVGFRDEDAVYASAADFDMSGTWKAKTVWIRHDGPLARTYDDAERRYGYLGFVLTADGFTVVSAISFVTDEASRDWVSGRLGSDGPSGRTGA